MRIFVTGSAGQLGRALLSRLGDHTIASGDLPEWNITNLAQVSASMQEFKPEVVLHTAALTAVDYCAQNPLEAVRVNGVGTYNVAVESARVGAMMVAISTNEVFDGQSDKPYQEYDQRNPVNSYGYSKMVAEQVVERYAAQYMICRTSWLYSHSGVNFIHKIVARAQSGEPLRVVTDEVGSPTYVPDLVAAIDSLITLGRPGIYHLTNAGECSRYAFAEAILQEAGLDQVAIEPISLADFQRTSNPPPYSPLVNVFAAEQGVVLRPWREALHAYFDEQISGDGS